MLNSLRTVIVLLGSSLLLVACQPPQAGVPRATAATILDITPAATFDIDATATNYAIQLIPSPTPAGLYIVQSGDTLSGLAQDFGTTVEEIMAANGLTDPNAIQIGQTLIIPSLVDRELPTAGPVSPTVPTATPIPTSTPRPTATRIPPTAVPPTEPPLPTELPTELPPPPPPTDTPVPAPLEVPTETPVP